MREKCVLADNWKMLITQQKHYEYHICDLFVTPRVHLYCYKMIRDLYDAMGIVQASNKGQAV